MFGPNIRGVAKRNLRFELAGWRNREDNSLIKHRYPWRISWIERLAGDSSLSPALARSGQVYLVRKLPAAATSSTARMNPSARKNLVLFGAISAIGVLAGALYLPTTSPKKVIVAEAGQIEASSDCKRVLLNPELEIASWLSGAGSENISFQEVQRQEIGGVQLRRISATCDDQQEDFQITLALRDKSWELKKFTRLGN